MLKLLILTKLLTTFVAQTVTECLLDPDDGKYYSICEKCQLGATDDGLKAELHDKLLLSLGQKIDDLFESEKDPGNIDLVLDISIRKTSPEDVFKAIITGLKVKENNPFELDKFLTETWNNIRINEQFFVPTIIVLISSMLYTNVISYRLLGYIFITFAYSTTYIQELEKYTDAVISEVVGQHSSVNSGWFGSFFSSGMKVQNVKSLPNPVKVFVVMITETIIGPLPIFAETLNHIVRSLFNDLNYMVYPLMILLVFTFIFLVWFLIFFKSGLKIKTKLLYGLLGDFEIGLAETTSSKAKSLPFDIDRMEKLCSKLEHLKIDGLEQSSKPKTPEKPKKSPLRFLGFKNEETTKVLLPVESKKSPKTPARVRKLLEKSVVITKQIGRNHSGLASLAHFIPLLTENDIWDKLENIPFENGIDLDQLLQIAEIDLDDYVKNVEIIRPKSEVELRDVFDSNGKFLVNFQMDKVYPQTVDKDGVKIGNFGHFCPVLGFTEYEIKLGEVYPSLPDEKTISYESLFKALNTKDPITAQQRGLLKFNLK